PERTCTDSVASSSSFPTALRRSGCRSESHEPRSLPCSVQAGLYSSGVHAVKRTRLGGRDSSGTCASARRQGGPGSAARGARRLQFEYAIGLVEQGDGPLCIVYARAGTSCSTSWSSTSLW